MRLSVIRYDGKFLIRNENGELFEEEREIRPNIISYTSGPRWWSEVHGYQYATRFETLDDAIDRIEQLNPIVVYEQPKPNKPKKWWEIWKHD